MNTTAINIRTEVKMKAQIEKLAKELNLSLDDLINTYFEQIIKHKSEFTKLSELPSKYLLDAIKTARKERKQGKTSPMFENAEDAIAWLNS